MWLEFNRTSRNIKDKIRGITHMHHAVDAATLAFITHLVVPDDGVSNAINGALAKYLA